MTRQIVQPERSLVPVELARPRIGPAAGAGLSAWRPSSSGWRSWGRPAGIAIGVKSACQVPTMPQGRRVTRVTLYQRPSPVFDISFAPGELPPTRPRNRRHSLDSLDAITAMCGYRRLPTDLADWPVGAYSDPMAENCQAGCI